MKKPAKEMVGRKIRAEVNGSYSVFKVLEYLGNGYVLLQKMNGSLPGMWIRVRWNQVIM